MRKTVPVDEKNGAEVVQIQVETVEARDGSVDVADIVVELEAASCHRLYIESRLRHRCS
jgi:hypothetical protein